MADNQKQQTCEGDTNCIRTIPQRSAIQRQKKTDTLEDIIRQLENQTQQENYWIYTKARYDTPTDNTKGSTQYNNGPETTNDCIVNPHAAIPSRTTAVDNKAVNHLKNVDNIPAAKVMSTMIQISKHNKAE